MLDRETIGPIFTFILIILYILWVKPKCVKKRFDMEYIGYNLNNNNIFIISNEPKLKKYVDIINFEYNSMLYKFFNNIDTTRDVHIIILTEGGECGGADTMAYNITQLKNNGFNKKILVYLPAHAMSSGTMMALAGDVIFMDWFSNMSPIDTQIEYELEDNETFSVNNIRRMKIDGEFKNSISQLIKNDAEAIYKTDIYMLNKILKNYKNRGHIIKQLYNTKLSHGTSFCYSDIKEMGLNVKTPIPYNIKKITDKLINLI